MQLCIGHSKTMHFLLTGKLWISVSHMEHRLKAALTLNGCSKPAQQGEIPEEMCYSVLLIIYSCTLLHPRVARICILQNLLLFYICCLMIEAYAACSHAFGPSYSVPCQQLQTLWSCGFSVTLKQRTLLQIETPSCSLSTCYVLRSTSAQDCPGTYFLFIPFLMHFMKHVQQPQSTLHQAGIKSSQIPLYKTSPTVSYEKRDEHLAGRVGFLQCHEFYTLTKG